MRGKLLRREAAKRDLIAQWLWYAENADIQTADRFLSAVYATLVTIGGHPLSGASVRSSRPELEGLRRIPVGRGFRNVLLFYFPVDRGIELVRVLHGSRELGIILKKT